MYYEPTYVFYAGILDSEKVHLTTSALNRSSALPHQVHLLTLEHMNDGQRLLMRLENRASNEDAGNPDTISVSLKHLLSGIRIVQADEMTLSGDVELNSVNRLQWKANEQVRSEETSDESTTLIVRLKPMQIRTFIVTAERF